LLDEKLYEKLIEEAIRKYGTAKKLSAIINEKLMIMYELADYKEKSIVDETFGMWKELKLSGKEYVKNIRSESEKRLKKMGL